MIFRRGDKFERKKEKKKEKRDANIGGASKKSSYI